jgi:hypothetical protein
MVPVGAKFLNCFSQNRPATSFELLQLGQVNLGESASIKCLGKAKLNYVFT